MMNSTKDNSEELYKIIERIIAAAGAIERKIGCIIADEYFITISLDCLTTYLTLGIILLNSTLQTDKLSAFIVHGQQVSLLPIDNTYLM